jgi:hypothetical protein
MSALRDHIAKWSKGRADDMREMAARQDGEWDAAAGMMQALQPGDPTAEEVLRRASSLLASITVNYGSIHGWTLAQHHVIYRTACRVFGPGQLLCSKPNWTESF